MCIFVQCVISCLITPNWYLFSEHFYCCILHLEDGSINKQNMLRNWISSFLSCAHFNSRLYEWCQLYCLTHVGRWLTEFQKDRQSTYTPNIEVRSLNQFLSWKCNNYYIFWARLFSLSYLACNTHAPYSHLWPVRLIIYFQIIS